VTFASGIHRLKPVPQVMVPNTLGPNLWHRLQRTGRGGVQTSTRNPAAASVVRWVTEEPVDGSPKDKANQ
jgi:hypothetical protein